MSALTDYEAQQVVLHQAIEQIKATFSDDPEINRLCVRRAEIMERVSYNRLSEKEWKSLSAELGEIEDKLHQLGE